MTYLRMEDLELAGKRRQGTQPLLEILEDEEENPQSHPHLEDDVEVVTPRVPRTLRAQERIVQVMERPQRQYDDEQAGGRRPNERSSGYCVISLYR